MKKGWETTANSDTREMPQHARVPAEMHIGGVRIAPATVHVHNGFFMNWYGKQKGEGFEYHLLAIAVGLVILIKGAGALSVDHALSGGGE